MRWTALSSAAIRAVGALLSALTAFLELRIDYLLDQMPRKANQC
ncbi:hypothetical protein ACHIPZ_13765 [Antrihabitans sp. NCIMB 15449]|uniref:Uncharacterized protein n=1 Tax=Antrihabitans spumae TaxID=3373370 RepID=A0ABW7JN57_9NOCA